MYRIFFHQILAPPKLGSVNFALRLSIPVFVEPTVQASPHLVWSIERSHLVAVNEGGQRETVRDIAASTPDGHALQIKPGESPYVLAGATRRWRIVTPNFAALGTLRLKADAGTGAIDRSVTVRNTPP